MRWLTEDALTDLALGAAVLGTGGGGDPHVGTLIAREAIRAHGPVTVVDPSDLDDEALVVPVAMMGAPTVANEKLPSLESMDAVVHAVGAVVGRTPTHVMPLEIGGIAALLPVAAAAQLGLPLVDADMMGRAFPELQMVIPSLAGVPATPMSMADEWGNSVVLRCEQNAHTERLARSVCVAMGATALIALYPVTGAQVRAHTVLGSVTRAEQVGATLRQAQAAHVDGATALADALGGFRLFAGKVIDLDRRTEAGFSYVQTVLQGIGPHAGATVRVTSQNEHLLARGDGGVLAMAPDLIVMLDDATGAPVTTEALRYGLRVTVLGIPCDSRFRTPEGLAVVGPSAFGFTDDYVPVEVLAQAQARTLA